MRLLFLCMEIWTSDVEWTQSLVPEVVEYGLSTDWNRVQVFYNNTSASFDTISGIQKTGSENCRILFDYYLEPLVGIQ